MTEFTTDAPKDIKATAQGPDATSHATSHDGENESDDERGIIEAVAVEGAPDKLVRLMADFDNFRRRSAKEKLLERQRGRREAAEKILPVYDSVAAALMTIKPDQVALRTGLEAVQSQVLRAFDGLGISRIATVGEKFDPQIHEALMHTPSPQHAEGIIVAESRAGFTDEIGMLRAAQVVVSQGS